MPDITNTHLEAAFIDQNVAGWFPNQRYAFIAVHKEGGGWQLGVAVEDEPGYNPIAGKTFTTHREADEWATALNEHIGLSADEALLIIVTTMRERVA